MTAHLLVETQSGTMSDRFLADALALARARRPVTVFLTGDAVASAVRGANAALAELVAAGGEVWVDDFTLAQRALVRAPLAPGVTVADITRVAGLVTAAGTRVVWH